MNEGLIVRHTTGLEDLSRKIDVSARVLAKLGEISNQTFNQRWRLAVDTTLAVRADDDLRKKLHDNAEQSVGWVYEDSKPLSDLGPVLENLNSVDGDIGFEIGFIDVFDSEVTLSESLDKLSVYSKRKIATKGNLVEVNIDTPFGRKTTPGASKIKEPESVEHDMIYVSRPIADLLVSPHKQRLEVFTRTALLHIALDDATDWQWNKLRDKDILGLKGMTNYNDTRLVMPLSVTSIVRRREVKP